MKTRCANPIGGKADKELSTFSFMNEHSSHDLTSGRHNGTTFSSDRDTTHVRRHSVITDADDACSHT